MKKRNAYGPYRCLAVSSALLASACLAACGGNAGDTGAGKEPEQVAQVTLTQVLRADISRILMVNGSVAAVPNLDVR
ncbi:MAG: hypothetical protein ACRD5L_05050, partial [Bryobacteraceae bacterium]